MGTGARAGGDGARAAGPAVPAGLFRASCEVARSLRASWDVVLA